jgi:hypothetical protein
MEKFLNKDSSILEKPFLIKPSRATSPTEGPRHFKVSKLFKPKEEVNTEKH